VFTGIILVSVVSVWVHFAEHCKCNDTNYDSVCFTKKSLAMKYLKI